MTDEEIREQVFLIVAKHAGRDRASLTVDTTLQELGMASLDIVQMLFALEDTFDVYVRTEQQQLRSATLGQVCDEVKKLVAARHG